jgi:GTPase
MPKSENLPSIVIVGRPNVGKSTLFNAITGQRRSIVGDEPGITRDRIYGAAEHRNRRFELIDTGGIVPNDVELIPSEILRQARVALEHAKHIIFVIDGRTEITGTDRELASILRKLGKPVALAVNKIDAAVRESLTHEFYSLGFEHVFGVSAEHKLGLRELLDHVTEGITPEEIDEEAAEKPKPKRIKVAIIGRPNVGKSSLLNKLAGEERAVVDDVSGTTVDPVDELVELGGRTWRFIDTAGIRKRVKTASGHEYYASLRTATAMERAEVAILVIDGSQSISEQDLRIIQTVRESGRALVIAFNKWDLVDDERRYYLEREYERELVQVQWAPRINVTARTGWHIDRIVPALDAALEGWETRISTGTLNAFLGRLVAEHPHPVRGGKQPKILFGTQPQTAPPTFILFTSGKLDAGYERYIERRLREEFGFVGTPIALQVRPREKRRR